MKDCQDSPIMMIMLFILLLKTKQANSGLAQGAKRLFMMEKHLPFSYITANLFGMFVLLSKIKKAIFGSVEMVGFGAMTAVHLPISHRILLGMSTKIKMETFGLVLSQFNNVG